MDLDASTEMIDVECVECNPGFFLNPLDRCYGK